MGDRLLTTIIELEKSLLEEVREEGARAEAWRAREVAALEVELAAAQQALATWLAGETAAARQAAQLEGERYVAAAVARCARLAAVPDAVLEEVLLLKMRLLLPEVGDDHPYGEG